MKKLPLLTLISWICFLFYAGIGIFLSGFLLVKVEVNRTSSCRDPLFSENWSLNIYSKNVSQNQLVDFCWSKPRFSRAVILIIDALKYDFAQFDSKVKDPQHFQNKIKVFSEFIQSSPANSRLYAFRADPPTTTMQRIKGFTTGTLPTFVDIGNNFASSAILEDNLISQMQKNGKRVVFMGDDTWDSLFPKHFQQSFPFPSFNVKDLHTVDNGILKHLYPSMKRKDWDIIIAHFLGVDHCGHRYGPDHPAMAEKLTQMDQVIRSVARRIENDTLLVVFGDHGMTDTGDHGGESQKETDAALFLYTPSMLVSTEQELVEPMVVPQIDLTPTLALLLGIPIPYSSIGKVMVQLIPSGDLLNHNAQELEQAEALFINAKQVNRFLETYSLVAKHLPQETLDHLQDMYLKATKNYTVLRDAFATHSPLNSQELKKLISDFHIYLVSVQEMCKISWAQFHCLQIIVGIIVLVGSCVVCFIVSEFASIVESSYKELLYLAIFTGAFASGTVAIFQYFWSEFEAFSILGTFTIVAQVAFLWKFNHLKNSNRYFLNRALNIASTALKGELQMTSPLIVFMVFLLRCASLFSDSYIVAEEQVVSFLLLSLGLFILVHHTWHGNLLHSFIDGSKNTTPGMSSQQMAFLKEKKTMHVLVACVALLMFSLCLSHVFHGCRDEQVICTPSLFLAPLCTVQDVQLRNIHYVLSVCSLFTSYYLVRRWLCHYGNFNSHSLAVFVARFELPLLVVCICLYWAVSSTPEESFVNWQQFIRLASSIFPRVAFVLFCLGMAAVFWNPLTVFVKPKVLSEEGPITHSYRANACVSPQAELLHLIPHIYQCMRRSYQVPKEEGESPKDVYYQPTVEAFGLGTVYSAPMLLILVLFQLLLALLHPEGLALSFLLMLLEAFAILQIHSTTSSLHCSRLYSDKFSVPWCVVLMWALAATQFFYATGHLPTFPSIQWNAAFTGFSEGHSNQVLPALLVLLNTFSSCILLAVSCPLLLFWPLICEPSNTAKSGSRLGELKSDYIPVMEMKLRDNPEYFSRALLQLMARYIFIHGAQVRKYENIKLGCAYGKIH
ncbi:GPI ethanolamine phosphate transferase 3 [Polypterus senegalus]|uniref:GPI ethanolamine phosphate transferase 3 n=1 Tax=Polypterus senegalus TaxID=55291 RepID=UPI0019635D7D|nr:GPI ethanolamine phosphate transferase 3 [Polypterus senegalus]